MIDDEFDPFRMMNRINKMFKDMDGKQGFGAFDKFKSNVREPLVNFQDTEKELKIIVELPGVDKKDIDLRVKNNYLIISTTVKKNKEKKDEEIMYQESSYQKYYRTVPLPEYVDPTKINTKYNNGILEITIAKKKSKNDKVKKIEIK